MKILYLTKGDHVDYQNDCLLIGLKELYGADVVDYNKQSHNYVTYDQEQAKKLYGMGMSVTRVLPDLEVDRTDITSKIKNRYFDYIVYGSIWRCNDKLNNILEYYPANKVIAVDGEDEQWLHEVHHKIPYFKREMIASQKNVYPISFAIPTSKVNFVTEKTTDVAYIKPYDKSTYIYDNEQDYYKGYQEARIAITIKKAGWDCMRHYEILANGCIPLFGNIEKCPLYTLTRFPKETCIHINSLLKQGHSIPEIYESHWQYFKEHLMKYNTTQALASYFINTISKL